MAKHPLGIDVLTAARQRIAYVFDNFPRVYVSFSGGKDSTVMLHLVMEEAARRNRKTGVMFIDWEAQYRLTIDHVGKMFDLYADRTDPYWIALPMTTVSAISQFEPEWICWEPNKEERWVRERPASSISDESFFPFYHRAMTFEEFVPQFGQWYAQGQLTACFVGIRAAESLNRYTTITRDKSRFEERGWTTWCGGPVYNAYPIYDWRDEDDWRYFGKFGKPYNHLYDLMHKAGVPIHNQRIDELFGPEARRSLWMLHAIEPETWARVVGRVSGANTGALYSRDAGNILGNRTVTLPPGHTWKSFAELILASMPPKTADHYKDKLAVYLKWYRDRGFPNGIPDCQDNDTGQHDKASWRRICKVLLRNDYWCKDLCFSPTKAASYEKYRAVMKARRQRWGIYSQV